MFVEFEGKVALVTGGVRGIGLNIAEALVREGASVFICGRNPATLKTALGHLRTFGAGTSAAGTVADVRSYKDCRKVVQQAATQFGGIDILVNNAGIGIFKPIDHLTAEEWDTSIQTNLSSAFYCCHEAVPIMRQQGGGHIFNISSLLAIHGIAGGSAYCASKFGMNGLADAMMQDIRYDGIRVSTIMPGSVATDFGGETGSNLHEPWKLSGKDIAKAVIDIYRYPGLALVSRIEIRPCQPPRKG
ncbi:MAG TPA: SDR family oxidoreductase [Terriglobales bacterium]|nr:SDR family oxidoreductase [Terriglobales bacterium]